MCCRVYSFYSVDSRVGSCSRGVAVVGSKASVGSCAAVNSRVGSCIRGVDAVESSSSVGSSSAVGSWVGSCSRGLAYPLAIPCQLYP